MKNVLVIESSHNREHTGSRFISGKIQTQLKTKYPEAKFSTRDLTQNAPPHLSETTLASFALPSTSHTPEHKEAIQLSDQLTEELLRTDLVLISLPLWNFSIPSSLKAWIDHIARAGKTFSYSASGAIPLVKNTKAIVVISTGGIYSEGPMKANDFAVPYLQNFLNFIGITDVQIVRVEGTAYPDGKVEAVKRAEIAIQGLKI